MTLLHKIMQIDNICTVDEHVQMVRATQESNGCQPKETDV